MATEKQIAANQRNGLRSTGPRTAEGKARSSANALWHGMSAQKLLLDGEDPQQLETLRQSLHEEFQPAGAVEAQLVETLATFMWRLARSLAFEASIINFTTFAQRHKLDPSPWGDPRRVREHYVIPEDDHPKRLGRAIKELFTYDLLAKVSRYEAHLMRQYQHTFDRLCTLQRERGAVAPAAKPAAAKDQGSGLPDITIKYDGVLGNILAQIATQLISKFGESMGQRLIVNATPESSEPTGGSAGS